MTHVLKRAGLDTISKRLYTQIPSPPTSEAKALLAGSGSVIMPLFSPRSAVLAAEVFADHKARLFIAAVSDRVAERAQSLKPDRLIVAKHPDAPSLIDAIAFLTESSESG